MYLQFQKTIHFLKANLICISENGSVLNIDTVFTEVSGSASIRGPKFQQGAPGLNRLVLIIYKLL